MSSSIGEQFWAPKTIPVRPSAWVRRTSSALRTGAINSAKSSNRRFHAAKHATVSRKSSQ